MVDSVRFWRVVGCVVGVGSCLGSGFLVWGFEAGLFGGWSGLVIASVVATWLSAGMHFVLYDNENPQPHRARRR